LTSTKIIFEFSYAEAEMLSIWSRADERLDTSTWPAMAFWRIPSVVYLSRRDPRFSQLIGGYAGVELNLYLPTQVEIAVQYQAY
jgi:hypothetical protein